MIGVSKFGLAFGGIEALAFAGQTRLAKTRERVEQANVGGRIALDGLFEECGIERCERFGDLNGGELLAGLVNTAGFVIADDIEEEADARVGIFTSLLVFEPVLVAGFFPAREAVFVEIFTE